MAYKLKNKVGIEIGGPSDFFKSRSYFPVYLFAKRIDGVNFSVNTVWEGELKEGDYYRYFKNKIGTQYIKEATDLNQIADERYDFVLSCHNLEHVANPIKALKEWKRVLKKEGSLVLVLPKKESTFDVNRPFTTFDHLLSDFKNDITEKDSTHFEEIARLHSVEKDTGVQNQAQLKHRLEENFINRCAHHHVFNFPTIKEMLEFSGFKVIWQEDVHNFHLLTFAVSQS